VPSASRRAALRRRLLAWYDAGHRDLPWRFPQRGADPYRVWLAEVMLQQTQVATVVPYFERFVARFPTLAALADAEEDEVLALWSGLGYYARGRNLLAAAREAHARHGGLPASVEALRALPGFGPYTAGAVASIAFALPAAAVDGNVARVLSRLFAVRGEGGTAAFRRSVEAIATELVGAEGSRSRSGSGSGSTPFVRPGDLNQALMELGATICTPRAPRCGRCPVAARCAARVAGAAAEIPPPRRRPVRRALVLACAILRRNGLLLLSRRPAGGLFGGLWAPPSAEVAPGEDAGAVLARALEREHRVRCAAIVEVATCERILTHRTLTLRAFHVEPARSVRERHDLRWAAEASLHGRSLPSAVRSLLARLGGAPARAAG
jgi:A/G-specific adenine glycosylase